MIIDLRTYTCRPGKMNEFIALYKERLWPLQQKHLGRCIGWYASQEGMLNQVVHLWQYDDQGDRERRRAAMAADPEWQKQARFAEEAGLLTAQENRILRPTDFCPLI